MSAVSLGSLSTSLPHQSMLVTALLAFVLAVVSSIFIRVLRRSFQFPPGPWFLQFTILWSVIKSSSEERIDQLYMSQSKKFGKIFSYRLGQDLIVVLSDPSIIREAVLKQKSVFNNRICPTAYIKAFGGQYEHRIVTSNGQIWKTARRLISMPLKNIGSWGEKMESLVLKEADFLLDRLSSNGSTAINPSRDIGLAVANIIHAMVQGYRLSYDDQIFHELIDSVQTVTSHPISRSNALRYLPFLYHLPSVRPFRKAFSFLKHTMSIAVSEHTTAIDGTSNDTIIERIILAAKDSEREEGVLKTNEIWRLLFDIMVAGLDTMANTLAWSMLVMAHYQEIQTEIHKEVDGVLEGRSPCTKDQKSMPYTCATLKETLRYRPVAPLAIPHVASQTAVLQGYTIPKGATLHLNLWSCHHDPEHWKDPEIFNPKRFLADDGVSLLSDPPAFVPFGVGPRMCAGDQLAKTELFLIFTRLLQRFHIEFASDHRPVTFDDGVVSNVVLRPNEMKIRFMERKV